MPSPRAVLADLVKHDLRFDKRHSNVRADGSLRPAATVKTGIVESPPHVTHVLPEEVTESSPAPIEEPIVVPEVVSAVTDVVAEPTPEVVAFSNSNVVVEEEKKVVKRRGRRKSSEN